MPSIRRLRSKFPSGGGCYPNRSRGVGLENLVSSIFTAIADLFNPISERNMRVGCLSVLDNHHSRIFDNHHHYVGTHNPSTHTHLYTKVSCRVFSSKSRNPFSFHRFLPITDHYFHHCEGWYLYQRNPHPLANPNIQFLSPMYDLNIYDFRQ